MSPTPGAPNTAHLDVAEDGTLFSTDRVVELRIEFAAEDWLAIQADPEAQEYYRADLEFDGVRVENVGVRTKGNSSLRFTVSRGSIRFPFKVDIDYFVDDQLLFGERKFNLNNGFKDPTSMREHLAYELAREFGIPAPRSAFVDLYVNDEHIGLYLLVEQVDTNFLAERFEDDQGDLYKPEPPTGELNYLGSTIDAYPDHGLTTNENSSDHSAFLHLVTTLNRGAPEEYRSVLDIDLALRYLALNALLVNLDSYLGPGHNYYLYEQEGVFSLVPWDLNEAFGHFDCGCNREGLIHFFIDEPCCGPFQRRPLAQRLLTIPENLESYHEYLWTLIDGSFSVDSMDQRIEDLADLIRPYVTNDPTTPYTLEQFETSLTDDPGIQSPGGIVIGLRTFVMERGASVRAQLEGSQPSTNEGRGGCLPMR